MLRKYLLLLLVSTQVVSAQESDFLKIYSQTHGYRLGRPVKARFSHTGRLLYLQSPPLNRSQSLYEWRNGRSLLLLKPEGTEELSPEEKARNERQRQLGTGFTDFLPSPNDDTILLPLAGRLILLQDGKTKTLPIKNAIDPKWSPDGKKIAYIQGQDIWVYTVKSAQSQQITKGGTLEKTHGLAEFVAQEEMGRLSGYCWSPDSRQIAYEVADHRGVEVWYISDPLHPEKPPTRQYYPRPNKKNVKVSLNIVNLTDLKTRQIKLPLEYLASMKWTKEALTLQLQDREQHIMRLVKVEENRLLTLQEETSTAYVVINQSIPQWIDKHHFLTLKRRLDRMALFVSDLQQQGHFLEAEQDYDIEEIVTLDKNQALLRIDKTPGNPRLHWVALDKSKVADDPPEDGIDEATYYKGHLALQQQNLQHLPRLLVDGQVVSSPALEPELSLNAEFVQVQNYRTLILRPHDFQKDKKYPVILDVYGGPTKIQVVHSQRAWLVDQWLANQGFIVVAIDNRGTPGRGLAWREAVYTHFDTVPLDDQITALTLLGQKYPELDLQRLGCWGWSFGGYLSAQAVLKRPDFFKCAVAGAPVTDWADYDTHYTERYLGLGAEAYQKASLINLAQHLTRPLLLVHGSADDNVYFRHSLRLAEALLRHNQPYELLVLPGITHSFRPDTTITQRLWARSVSFFKSHLQ